MSLSRHICRYKNIIFFFYVARIGFRTSAKANEEKQDTASKLGRVSTKPTGIIIYNVISTKFDEAVHPTVVSESYSKYACL